MGIMHIPGHEQQKPREVSLEEIRAVLGDCRLCELCQTRTNIVFGVGNPHARVMFVGEAPGRNEDLRGEPFVDAPARTSMRFSRLLGSRETRSILPTCSNVARRETAILSPTRCLHVRRFCASRSAASGRM